MTSCLHKLYAFLMKAFRNSSKAAGALVSKAYQKTQKDRGAGKKSRRKAMPLDFLGWKKEKGGLVRSQSPHEERPPVHNSY